jgi:galactose mutarotase-like enzyme
MYPQLRQEDWEVLGSGGMSVVLLPEDSPVELDTQFELREAGLTVELRATNPTRQRVPFNVSVMVHLNRVAERVQLLAPAEEVVVDGARTPVSGRFDLRRPKIIDAPVVADFTRRHFANLQTLAAILAPECHRELWFVNSADFRDLCVRLQPDGAGTLSAETGERSLAPGEAWRGSAVLTPRIGRPAAAR